MKRAYSIDDLKNTNDTMRNYTVDVKVYGTMTSFKVHVGTVGNHYEIVCRLVAQQFGRFGQITGAKVTGKAW